MTNHRNAADPSDEDRVGELERIGPRGDDVSVLGVQAPRLEALSAGERLLAYYLSRAAIAGNAVAFKQCHRHAYQIKSLLEAVQAHSNGLSPDVAAAVLEYLKLVWIHHGQYDHYSHAKFTPPSLDAAMLRGALEHAVNAGAQIGAENGKSPSGTLDRLERSIFDPDFEPLQTNQSEGSDIVATSAVNYWDPGITLADIQALPKPIQNRLNVRFARRNGGVEADVYRLGGVYGENLKVIAHFLELALPYAASPGLKSSIEALLDYYRSGDEVDFRRHSVHWLRSDGKVDYLNGFVETYLDPRGVIGQFEANVSVRSSGGIIDRLAANALYFERRMPWPEAYKRDTVDPPVATIVNVLVETGDAGPVSPAAYNLPNYNDIRQEHGSKNVILHNVENAWSEEQLQASVDAFFLPEYRENMIRRWRRLARPLQVYMHEVIGHGSGRPDPTLGEDPRNLLGRHYSTLEECRADLVALYHIADPKLIELGAFSFRDQRAVVETMFIGYLQGWFSRFDRVTGLVVREAHNKGTHTILSYLLDNGGDADNDFGVDVVGDDGHYYVHLSDLEKVHNGVGALLSRVQTIKSTGDVGGAEALFDRYGTRLEPEWKASVVARKTALGLPKARAFVFPHLVPVVEDGKVVDAELRLDENLTSQQMRYSRLELSLDPTAD